MKNHVGIFYAVTAALLFGASTPAAKFLLGEIKPWLLAGLLYLGAGLGIAVILIARSIFSKKSSKDSGFNTGDWKWLGGATCFGGIIGPVLFMTGLIKINGTTASLLLNLESIFTATVAWLIFKEHTSRSLVIGMVLIVLGGFVLTWTKQPNFNNIWGILLIVGACFSWALDNNFSQKISASDPLKIVAIKTMVAGLTNTLVSLMVGTILPASFSILVITGAIGFLGYGLSLIYFVLALRLVGTARTSAYFSLAPFIGVGFSLLFLGDPLSWQLIIASCLMGWGIWIHLTEKHVHEHQHEALKHSHVHTHEEHHQHEHKSRDPIGEPHCHLHEHEPLSHSHAHYPDIHHRHKH